MYCVAIKIHYPRLNVCLFNSLNSSAMASRQPVPEPFSEVKAIISVVTCTYLVVTQGITLLACVADVTQAIRSVIKSNTTTTYLSTRSVVTVML